MSKVFNNVKRFCAKSQLFAFCSKLWYNIYRKYERDINRKEVNEMLRRREKHMNKEDNKYEYSCKRVVIKFKESYNQKKAKEIKSEEPKTEAKTERSQDSDS